MGYLLYSENVGVDVVSTLKQGACCMIRSQNIFVIGSPWLPTAKNYCISPCTQTPINISVKDLWLPQTKTGIKEMVRNMFIEEDIDRLVELRYLNEGRMSWSGYLSPQVLSSMPKHLLLRLR